MAHNGEMRIHFPNLLEQRREVVQDGLGGVAKGDAHLVLVRAQTRGGRQFGEDILPVDVAVAGQVMLVSLRVVPVKMGGHDMRKHLVQNVVIPWNASGGAAPWNPAAGALP